MTLGSQLAAIFLQKTKTAPAILTVEKKFDEIFHGSASPKHATEKIVIIFMIVLMLLSDATKIDNGGYSINLS